MRYVRGGMLAGSLAAMMSLLLTGCGGVIDHNDEPIPSKKGKGQGKGSAVTEAPMETVKGDYKGVLRGKVVWEGAEPDLGAETNRLIDAMKAKGEAVCLHGSALEKEQQAYRIGKNKGLGNVVVWIAAPSGQVFDPPDDLVKQLPSEVVVSQPHCIFLPHCVSVTAARYKGGKKEAAPPQVLVVENDAETLHNANVKGGSLQRDFQNKALSAWNKKGTPSREEFTLKPDEEPVRITCQVHGWMVAYARSFDHPYHAVTSVGANLNVKERDKRVWEDSASDKFGTFEIKGVPVGATVTLCAWHEELGQFHSQPITLKETEEVTIKAPKKKQ